MTVAPNVAPPQQTFNDNQLDTISRSVFHDTIKFCQTLLKEENPDTEKMMAAAASLDAAACGFGPVDLEDAEAAEKAAASPFNDDLLNEMSRAVFVKCIQRVQNYVQGSLTMNTDKMLAYARLADAAASGFKEDGDDDE